MSKKSKEVIRYRVSDNATSVYRGDRLLGIAFVNDDGTVWVSIGQMHYRYDLKIGYKPFQNRNEGIAFILDQW